MHAAVIAINDAIEHQIPKETLDALHLPAAHLNNISEEQCEEYQEILYEAKQNKAEIARNKVWGCELGITIITSQDRLVLIVFWLDVLLST